MTVSPVNSRATSKAASFIPFISVLLLLSFLNNVTAQLSGTVNTDATTLAQALVGSGVTVSNATLVCPPNGSGFFTATAQSLGIGQGVVLTSGNVVDPGGFEGDISGPNEFNGAGSSNFMPGDPQLDALVTSGFLTEDACILEFDVVPQGDTLGFDYIFGSEEYNFFVNAGFNDVFGFFISGPGIPGQQNIAVIPGTASTPVSIDNVNCGSFSQFYICNDIWNPLAGGCGTGDCPSVSDPWDPEYNGLTTTLTAKAVVQPCQLYHLKLAIADVGDDALDSGVFLKQGSLTSATIEASPDVTICPGQSTQLSVTGVAAGVPVTWTPSTGLSCTNCTAPVATPSATTTYTVSISAGACSGSSISDQVVVTVGSSLQGSAAPTAATCGSSDGSVNLNVTSGSSPFAFSWSNGATTEDLNNVAGGTYTVTVTDATGCNATFSADVTTTGGPTLTSSITNATCSLANGSVDITINNGGAPYTFLWSNGNTGEDANALVGGDYSVTVTDANGCTLSESFTVNTTVIPNIGFASENPVCTASNGSIDATVTSGTPPYTYSWSNGILAEDISDLPAGNFELTVTDDAGCTSSFATQLIADPAPPLFVNGLVDSLCIGDSFTATATGFDTYTWTPAAGLSASTGNTVDVTAISNQTYSVTGTDANGCVNSVVFDVTAVPYAQVTFSETFSGCEPLTVDLVASATNASSVQWWIDGFLWSTQPVTEYTFYAGLHNATLVAVSPLGCNDTLTAPGFVDVMASPVADFGVALDASSGSLFNFNFTNSTTGATSYSWNFGDNTTDTVTNPYHIYPSYGSFISVLTAYNQYGCSDTAMRVVNVIIPKNVFIPNTITPNGDGMNETLKVYGLGIRNYKLKVFDRLGEMVFDGTDSRAHWDGTHKGERMNTATFVYLADIEFLDGHREQYWGDVNILR